MHTDDFISEVRTVLTYLDVIPFRSHPNRSTCFYCRDRKSFNTLEDMKNHMRKNHPNRTHKLEVVMRPALSNEVLKLDVQTIACTECDEDLEDWNNALEHLKTVHSLNLQYERRLIPYVLNGENICVVCKEEFAYFSLLDVHMNTHYKNYVCGFCGDPFLSQIRLKLHEKIHDVGRHTCNYCSKVFTLDKYLRKHIAFQHRGLFTVKCTICGEAFGKDSDRYKHVVADHKDHLEDLTCDICGSKFDWMPNYVRHMKYHLSRNSSKSKGKGTHYCKDCDKCFANEIQLVEHRHSFQCDICQRTYLSAGSLKSHRKYSHKNQHQHKSV